MKLPAHSWLLLPLVALLALPALAEMPSQPTRTIAGYVSKVGPGGQWFMLDCAGSRKHPRVKVTLDKSTRWTGPRELIHPARVGNLLRVTASGKPPEYKAVEINVLDPNMVPQESNLINGSHR